MRVSSLHNNNTFCNNTSNSCNFLGEIPADWRADFEPRYCGLKTTVTNDDGEEETVLDLTVKKGMNQGWVGNIDGGLGTEGRYSASANVNRFANDGDKSSQLSLIGRANNVNDQRFGGGGGPRWRRNNGLTASKMAGLNYAIETKKFDFGASVRYNYRDNDVQSLGQIDNFLLGNKPASYTNNNSASRNKNQNLNGHLRLEWRPDSLTTFFMRGGLSWGDSESGSNSLSSTYNSNPFEVVADPYKFLDFEGESNEELDAIVAKYTSQQPEYDFIAPGDGFGHTFWVIRDANVNKRITEIFAEIPALYVADGHHRTAAAARVGAEKREQNPNQTRY